MMIGNVAPLVEHRHDDREAVRPVLGVGVPTVSAQHVDAAGDDSDGAAGGACGGSSERAIRAAPESHRHRKSLEVLNDVVGAQRLPPGRDSTLLEPALDSSDCIVRLSK